MIFYLFLYMLVDLNDIFSFLLQIIASVVWIINNSVQIEVIIYRVILRAGHQTEEEICPCKVCLEGNRIKKESKQTKILCQTYCESSLSLYVKKTLNVTMDSVLRTVYLVSMLAGILLGEFPTCLGKHNIHFWFTLRLFKYPSNYPLF